jgi:hypothetical protein
MQYFIPTLTATAITRRVLGGLAASALCLGGLAHAQTGPVKILVVRLLSWKTKPAPEGKSRRKP